MLITGHDASLHEAIYRRFAMDSNELTEINTPEAVYTVTKLTNDKFNLLLLEQNLVSEMTYTVSSGTLNPSIPYHT